MTDFEVDKYVVVPEIGLGMIVDEFDDEDVKYFKILCRNVTISKPKKEMVRSGVRFPCSYDDIQRIIKILQGRRKQVKTQNNNQRYKKYKEQLNSPNVLVLAELVRNLYTKDVGELGLQRSELYEKALQKLTDEIVFVLKVSNQGARGIVESIIDRQPLPSEWQEKLKTP